MPSRAEEDYARTAKKMAESADFLSDMSTWPDAMVNAYLESGNVDMARAKFLEKLLQEAPA